ncbi:P-loop containing nucleoside triphosphate hydrolase protein [Tribonema minus]|uniref:P-loop containing nucleoside triphosphate hydrolase protein n=1 Tax=Tribonema minus TaxID=303371 RepID=A0A835ZG72_9STRA|nr:P-loop containing nucleoside triphosphate hydrolase protein [Tribonema minus]
MLPGATSLSLLRRCGSHAQRLRPRSSCSCISSLYSFSSARSTTISEAALHSELEVTITDFDASAGSSDDPSGEPATISNRAAFRALPIDNKVLAYLDSRDLGRELPKRASKRKRVLIEKGLHDLHSVTPESAALKTFDVPTWAVKKVASAQSVEEIPPPSELPEVAFVGRSNVGKSTLLNALLGLKGHPLVRAATSMRPGETRSIDFFRLGKGSKAQLLLVDTPGFGFAFAKEEESERFIATLLQYLRGRGALLKRVCMLLDARHGFKANDVAFLQRLYARKGQDGLGRNPLGPYKPPKLQVILTKCDLVQRRELARRVSQVRARLSDVTPRETYLPVLMVSALRDQAVEDLQKELAGLVPQARRSEDRSDTAQSSEKEQSSESREGEGGGYGASAGGREGGRSLVQSRPERVRSAHTGGKWEGAASARERGAEWGSSAVRRKPERFRTAYTGGDEGAAGGARERRAESADNRHRGRGRSPARGKPERFKSAYMGGEDGAAAYPRGKSAADHTVGRFSSAPQPPRMYHPGIIIDTAVDQQRN